MLQHNVAVDGDGILITTLQSPPFLFEKIFDLVKKEFSQEGEVQAIHSSETLAFSHILNCARTRHVIRLKGPSKVVKDVLDELRSRLLAGFHDSTQYRIIDWKFKHLQNFRHIANQSGGMIVQHKRNRSCLDHCTRSCKLTMATAGNQQLGQSFQWAPEEYIRFLKQTEAGSVYRVLAIHVSTTLKDVTFTEDELRLAARSLGNRPLNLNHKTTLEFPTNRVIDAEFEDGAVECLIVVADPAIINMIENKQITASSIEARARACEEICEEDNCSTYPKGVVLTGLALLTLGVLPGDPLARIIMKQKGQMNQKPSPATHSDKRIVEPGSRNRLGFFWSGMFAVMGAILATTLVASAAGKRGIDSVEAEKIARCHLQTRDVNDVALSKHGEDSDCYSFLFVGGSTRFTVKIDKLGKVIAYREEKVDESVN